MRIAVPIWRGIVSPLFESAGCLLVVRFAQGAELDRKRIQLTNETPAARAQLLWLQRVEVLICGALSRPVQRMLEANEVRVIGWIKGEVEEVLTAFVAGRLGQARFQLPGRRRRRAKQTDRRGRRRGG